MMFENSDAIAHLLTKRTAQQLVVVIAKAEAEGGKLASSKILRRHHIQQDADLTELGDQRRHEFATRLRKHLSRKSAEREETIAIEDPAYEDNTDTLLETDAK